MNNKYVTLDKATAEEYFSLPLEKRTNKVWFWPCPWYKIPNGMLWNGFSFKDEGECEWGKYYEQLVKEFSIQARIREISQYEFKWICNKISILQYRFSDKIYYPIRSIFKPQNRHLIKQIPRQYKSTAIILEDILIAAFINHCENGSYSVISYTDDPYCSEETNKYFRDRAENNKKIYDYLKLGRQVLKNSMESLWKSIDTNNEDTILKEYEAIQKIENEIVEKDTDALIYIAKNRFDLD